MAEINLSDSKGRDALVAAESVATSFHVRWVDDAGAQAGSFKILRSTVPHDLGALEQKYGDDPEEIAQAFQDGDPEVDLEMFGQFLEDTSRVYIDPDSNIVHKVTLEEVVYDPEGNVKGRREKTVVEPNVATETPIKWTGKKFKKSQIYNQFIFGSKVQIIHVNGLTYDFLYDMAKELEDEECLMRVGGGAKGVDKLLFRRGGVEYFGFLEGRTDGKKYALILHLTNMELKRPEPAEKGEPKEEEAKAEPVEKVASKKTAAAKKKALAKKTTKKTSKKKSAKKNVKGGK